MNPLEAKGWVEDYHRTFEEDCQPIGQEVNPRIAMVTGFGCHEDPAVARQRFKGGQDFFGFALAYYYGNGRHIPGIDDIWKKFIESGDEARVAATLKSLRRELNLGRTRRGRARRGSAAGSGSGSG